jgi:RNA polymerase sigma factor (TIGR02999 family)
MSPPTTEITTLLHAWSQGDRSAFDRLVPVVYAELRRVARCHMRGERQALTLETTGLVHEAYLKLIETRRLPWRDRVHFYAMASRIMRRILVDAARRRGAVKRGGGAVRVSVDCALELVIEGDVDIQALDDALRALEGVDPRKGQVVELRFFGGLTLAETATALGVSEDTVGRDWDFARTWLRRRLAHGSAGA